jgi:hypothetical protein
LNGTHQLLVYADDGNTSGGNLNTIKNKEALLDPSRKFGLEVNTEQTKYMVMSRYQNAGQNHSLLKANKVFENVAKYK